MKSPMTLKFMIISMIFALWLMVSFLSFRVAHLTIFGGMEYIFAHGSAIVLIFFPTILVPVASMFALKESVEICNRRYFHSGTVVLGVFIAGISLVIAVVFMCIAIYLDLGKFISETNYFPRTLITVSCRALVLANIVQMLTNIFFSNCSQLVFHLCHYYTHYFLHCLLLCLASSL